jgi:hypothetical protein
MVKLSMTKIVLSLALVALAGCSSATKSPPCASTDWYEIGRQHGSRGLASAGAKADPIQKSCKLTEQKLDAKALYDSGLSLGLTEYCTEANGYQLGKSNLKYSGTCPQALEESFIRGYRKGQKAVELSNEKEKVRSKIQSIEVNLQKAQSLALRGLLKAEHLTLVGQNATIEGQMTSIANNIEHAIAKPHPESDRHFDPLSAFADGEYDKAKSRQPPRY